MFVTEKKTTSKTVKKAAPKSVTKKSATPKSAPKVAKAKVASAPKVEPAAAKAEAPKTRTPPPLERPSSYTETLAMLSPEQQKSIEALSANLARAAVTAQSAIAEVALRNAERPPTLSADPFHVTPALTEVMGKLASQPDRMLRAQADLFSKYMELWQSAAKRAGGEDTQPVIEPAKGDKRFNDPEWSNQPVFDIMKQSYLLTSNWLNSLVAEVEGVDPMTKRRVEFFTKMLTDAFSPTNFLMSNPAALREAVTTQGESLAKGMENFAADLSRGGGNLAITQSDDKPFIVGENIATSPGKVIFQNAILQVLQFNPSTEQVHEIPLLIFPPWINKWYILDLRVENSMIRWLTSQGYSVFVCSWVNPDATLATRTFEQYMFDGIYEATAAVMKQAGTDKINAVGYCIGGTLLACAMAHMAAKGDTRINSATFFASQQDFTEAGDLALFTNDEWIDDIERRMDAEGGLLPAQNMADTFNSLRANDLIWSFFVSNYLLGKEPKPFDLLFWNADQTRMPKTLHLFYLREFYGKNKLSKGELVFDGVALDLGSVKTPVFVQSSKDDHISPFRSVYNSARLFGGPVTFMLAGSGHIAGVINPPSANKYQHWTNPDLPLDAADWFKAAEEHKGSWWPLWSTWLAERSAGMVAARDPEKGPFKPLEDAPGSFVLARS
jgi:polyhydroxyalkanoate synthase